MPAPLKQLLSTWPPFPEPFPNESRFPQAPQSKPPENGVHAEPNSSGPTAAAVPSWCPLLSFVIFRQFTSDLERSLVKSSGWLLQPVCNLCVMIRPDRAAA